MTAARSRLELRALSCGILENVDLIVNPGEVVCISGPSGSGKTRLLRAVADLDPHSGDVSLDGALQSRTPAHRWRRWVMLVPAESQWWAERVRAHFPADTDAGPEALGLPAESLDWEVSRLSSGERQRLAILRAVAHGPRALLLDEPTANLDDESTRGVERWLARLVREHGWPVLWVAHDPAQIERVAGRHLHIVDGRLATS
jgi:sulfonate transport system ATP-binding protein